MNCPNLNNFGVHGASRAKQFCRLT